MDDKYEVDAFKLSIDALCRNYPGLEDLIRDNDNLLISGYFFNCGFEAGVVQKEELKNETGEQKNEG